MGFRRVGRRLPEFAVGPDDLIELGEELAERAHPVVIGRRLERRHLSLDLLEAGLDLLEAVLDVHDADSPRRRPDACGGYSSCSSKSRSIDARSGSCKRPLAAVREILVARIDRRSRARRLRSSPRDRRLPHPLPRHPRSAREILGDRDELPSHLLQLCHQAPSPVGETRKQPIGFRLGPLEQVRPLLPGLLGMRLRVDADAVGLTRRLVERSSRLRSRVLEDPLGFLIRHLDQPGEALRQGVVRSVGRRRSVVGVFTGSALSSILAAAEPASDAVD